MLPGPLPAGAYTYTLAGFGQVLDMTLTAVLSEVQLNQVLDTETFTSVQPDGGDLQEGVFLTVSKTLPAVAATCGDTLRLRVSLGGVDGGALDELSPGNPTIP